MRFNSDELLKEFGNDRFETFGLYCVVSHFCPDCDLWTSCRIGQRNDFNDTERDNEKEPCGHDYVIRNLHHGWPLRKYDFKFIGDKAWHDSQPLIFRLIKKEKGLNHDS